MTWYKVRNWTTDIEPVEFERVTAHFGIITGKRAGAREALASDYQRCFPTREQAVAHKHEKLIRSVDSAQSRLDRAQMDLAEFKKKENL